MLQALKLVVALLFIGAVVCQRPTPANFYPVTSDGFDTVFVDDMSFVSELNIQSFPSTSASVNVSFYLYGSSQIRTVFPGPNFYVGTSPNEYWTFPFIDFHTFQDFDGSIWGFGPAAPMHHPNASNPNVNPALLTGLQYETVIFSTKNFPNTPYGFFFVRQPIGFEGIFSAVHVAAYDLNNVVAYFAGFFPLNASNPQVVSFGVVRAHLDMNAIRTGNITEAQAPWSWNNATDIVALYPYAQLVPFNVDFKPTLLHLYTGQNTSTYLAVVDPYWNTINVVTADINPTVPLTVNYIPYRPRFGRITSTAVFGSFILVGIALNGNATGWVDVVDFGTLSTIATINFPANAGYSNPASLVVDYQASVLYVGFNGGPAVLKIDISKVSGGAYSIIGYQATPPYLHRLWVGAEAPEHVYYATNEQHTKVFRVAKADFCPAACPFFGFCKNGKCECDEGFEMQDKECKWKTLVKEIEREKRNKGGEIALGIFFTISFLAAVAGWYLVYRNKRSAYQAV